MPGRKVGDVPGGRPIVLYVEDDPPSQVVLYRAIHRLFAVDVVIAETAGDGLLAALSLKPALVFLDLGLPDADGSTVLSALRTHECGASMPIYALTADPSDARRLELLGAGATGYLTKPYTFRDLYVILESLGLPMLP